MDNSRASWAEIDLRAIRSNIEAIKQLISQDTKLMLVVKANAYGHGMIRVAKVCAEAGAAYLGVATLEEALELRAADPKTPILVLGYILPEYAVLAVKNHIDVCVYHPDHAQAYSKAADSDHPARLHIKLDTGMGRIGFQNNAEAITMIQEMHALPNIILQGIFTHFAVADQEDKSFTRQQAEDFKAFIKQLEKAGIDIPIKHLANSAAIMDLPEMQANMVRAGIVTYGLYPSDQVQKKNLPLIPAMRLKTRISHLKLLPPGQSVSYGRTYITERETLVATVPVGYADGYSRRLSNRIWASLHGQRIEQIGTICMDQCMFDVSAVEDVQIGDEIILFGRPEDLVTADDLAELTGTINYEVVCSVSLRIPRIFINE